MSTELRVPGAHLGELAAAQGAAADAIHALTGATEGLAVSVGATHGPIAASTATAVAAAVHVRRDAGTRIEQVSRGLQDRLRESAAVYTDIDETAGEHVDRVMRAGVRP